MSCILVTGGAGFIGSCFVRQWLHQEHGQVVNLDKLTYAGNLATLRDVADHPRHVFHRGDIADRERVLALLTEYRPDAIINFAAESHVDRSIDGPASFVQTNVVGTCQLLDAALEYWRELDGGDKAAFRFLHVSTDEVYGSLGPEGKFTETTPYSPRSPYSASKAASDHFVRAYHHTFGLPVLITNCTNNYGPYQFPEKLIPLMILNALEYKPLPVYGDGLHVRDWLHVEDHCAALRRVLEHAEPGETYNIGGGCEQANLHIVRAVCELVDELRLGPRRRDTLITYVPDRPGHDRRYAMDTSKIERDLDWRPTIDFATGLEQTVCWFLDNLDWVQEVTSGKYARQRLGVVRKAA